MVESPSGRVTLIIDWASQPCRAVAWFLYAAGIPFDVKEVRIAKMEHKSPEMLKLNPLGQIPVMLDTDGTPITESISMVRYLSHRYIVPAHLYCTAAADFDTHIRHEQFLDFYHLNIRYPMYTRLRRGPIAAMQGIVTPPEVLRDCDAQYYSALKSLAASPYFDGSTPFVNGDQISFGDMLAFCELEQCDVLGSPVLPFLQSHYPAFAAWYERVKATPSYTPSHKVFDILAAKAQNKKRASEESG